MEKSRWLVGDWDHENVVPATRLSPANADIGTNRVYICADGSCICFIGSQCRETHKITFDPFSRQWIYMLLRGFYGMLRKLWITCAVSLIAGVPLASSSCRGQHKPLSASPARLAVLWFPNISTPAKADNLAAGLADELITTLGQLDSDRIWVLALSSSRLYAGTAKPAAQANHSALVSPDTQYLFPEYASGGTAVTPSNLTTGLTGNNLTASGGIVAGSPTGGNEGAGTVNVATGSDVKGNSIATCVGGSAKVINGISYSACYPGSSFDARANACLADAAALANGNTSGICDSTGEPSVVYQYGQITVGTGVAGSPVVWKLAPGLYDHVTLTGGTLWAVLQQGYSAIECGAAQNSGCSFNNFSVTNGAAGMYSTGSTTGYRQMIGVWFKSIHGGTLASGNIAHIVAGYDGSLWERDQFIDDATTNVGNGTVAVIGGNTLCCHTLFVNDTFDSEWGQTAVSLVAPQYDQFNAVNFHDNTFNSHGPTAAGHPNILCTDSYHTLTAISFTGVTYMEGQSATMTAPFIQDNGCRALEFTGILEAYPMAGTGSTAPIIAVSNAFDTTLNVGAVVAYQGGGTNPWTYPATIVEQYNTTTDCGSPPCTVAVTDSAGNSPGYHSRTSQLNNLTVGGNLVVKALGNSTSPVCPNGTGGALTTSGCSEGANTSTGQHGSANVRQSFTIAASTTVGYVMSMTTTADKVEPAGLGSTNNVGIATTVGGTNAQLYVATQGALLTVFDGTPVVGDFACAPPTSTGTVGLAHDNGITACPAGQTLGVVTGQVSGTGSGATATVLLQIGR
jgi:hypothetical protein